MSELSWTERLGCAVARAGPTPKHIAFIMDGNRRFARERGLEVASGHRAGYSTLEQAVAWCGELDVHAITVYAFSIENFKRSTREVDALMSLCSEKLREMCAEDSLIQRHRVRVRVVGDLPRLSESIRADMERVMHMTQHNTRSVLTVCFAYTSRYEMASAIRSLAARCSAGELQPADVCESLFEQHMCTWSEQVPPPDLLIRTSGEKRLSDFLLWQSSRCVTLFSPVRWPELSCWTFLSLILRFQLALPKLHALLSCAGDVGAKASAHCVRAELASGDTSSTFADEPAQRSWLHGSLLLMLGALAGAASAMTVSLCLIGQQVCLR